MIEVPLNSSPEQLFSITLSGSTYNCRVILNSRTSVWSISISSQTGVDILSGIALVGGVDILKQYTLPFNNAYVINLDDSRLEASKDNLGTVAKLFILTDEEVSNV